MSAERVPEQGQALRLVGAGDGDAISVWLGVLVRLLRVPAREAEQIRDELESHLRERVRDLEVTGVGEEDAVRRAVSELGDAAVLAQRYREARSFPRRRLMMNLSMLAVAGAAVVGGVVALSQPGEGTRVTVFSPPEQTAAEQAALARHFDVSFKDAPLNDVFTFASKTLGMPVNVAWGSLADKGLQPDSRVIWVCKSDDFRTFVKGLNEQVNGGTDWALGYRIADGTVRVGTEEYFDRQETVLASYDLSGLTGVSGEDVEQVIYKFVQQPGWDANGGNLARLSMVGTKMFVEAPKRYHVQIKWFIEELAKDPGQASAGPGEMPAAVAELKRARDAAATADRAAAEKAHADEQAMHSVMKEEQLKRAMDELAARNNAMRDQQAEMDKQRQDQMSRLMEATQREEMAKRTAETLEKQYAELEERTAKMRAFSDDLQVQSAKEQAKHEVQVQAMQQRIEELSRRAAELEKAMKDAEQRRQDGDRGTPAR